MAAKRIDSIVKVDVTTSAKDVAINYRSFYIQNNSADKALYFKEKAEDDTAVTVDNGFCVPAGETLHFLLRAKTLSIKGEASLTAKIMYVTEEV